MNLKEIIDLNTEARRAQRSERDKPRCPPCLCVSDSSGSTRLMNGGFGFMNSSSLH